MEKVKERYNNIDGLRVIGCFGIIAMHIYANSEYCLGVVGDLIIKSFNELVPLFLLISGFGMFCGYYDKFKDGIVDFNIYFVKRYRKIIPFFSVLVLFDIVVEHSFSAVIEGLTEITLVFGLLPNNTLNIIGVSWTVGVIFLFYMLFPFFVFLCFHKKRAIISFCVSIVLALFCSGYFFSNKFVVNGFDGRHNFLYCTPFFLGGGIIYIYRNTIKYIICKKRLFLSTCIISTIAWYLVPIKVGIVEFLLLKNIFLFSMWLTYAICFKSKLLYNCVMSYLGNISMEMYLAQMVMFRILERTIGLYVIGNGWGSFIVIFLFEIMGLVILIEIYKRINSKAYKIFKTL